MLHYAVVFFVIALIAAFFGFSGIAAGAAGIAKILFSVLPTPWQSCRSSSGAAPRCDSSACAFARAITKTLREDAAHDDLR